jgi:hypothetical protein
MGETAELPGKARRVITMEEAREIAEDIQKNAEASRADIRDKLSRVESTHLSGEVKLKEAASKSLESDPLGLPVDRNRPLTDSAREDQPTVDADFRTIRASESITEEADAGSAAEHAENVRSIAAQEGAVTLTPPQADRLARAGEAAQAGDIIVSERGVAASKLPGARQGVEYAFDELTSDMRGSASVDDMTVNFEKARDAVELAVEERKKVKAVLAGHGVTSEARQDQVIDVLGKSAEKAAKVSSAIEGGQVKPGQVLDDAVQVMLGKREANSHADLAFKEFLINQRVRRENPDLMKWVETLFTENEKGNLKAA